MKLKLNVQDFKLIDQLNYEFDSSNVYLIKGKNEIGKSTLINALKSILKAKLDTKHPVSIGKTSSNITCIYEDKNNNSYSVNVEATIDGKTKFTFINENGLKSNSVTSIRDIFAYNDFSVEEFISWGSTAEGRRQQANVLLKCLPSAIQAAYTELLEKEKIIYDKRTPVISELTHLNKKLKETNITTEQLSAIESQEEILIEIDRITKQYNDYSLNLSKYNSYISQKDMLDKSYNSSINQLESTIKDAEEQIEYLQAKIKQSKISIEAKGTEYNDAISKLEKIEKPEVVNDELVSQATQMKEFLNNAIRDKQELNDIENRIKISSEEKDILDISIEETRQERAEILQSSKLFEDIFIEEDGIYIQTNNGYFPFNDADICMSQQIMTVTKILLKLNERTPVVFISRGESLDDKKLKALDEISKETDSIIIVEKVIDSDESKPIIEIIA